MTATCKECGGAIIRLPHNCPPPFRVFDVVADPEMKDPLEINARTMSDAAETACRLWDEDEGALTTRRDVIVFDKRGIFISFVVIPMRKKDGSFVYKTKESDQKNVG